MGEGERIFLYDTTLRDGSQQAGIHFSLGDKLRILERLDQFGIDYVEGGWPGSNPKDLEFFRRAKKIPLRHARLSAFGSTRRPGVEVQRDANVRALLEAGTPVVTVFGKSWDLHVREALDTDLGENLAMIRETVAFLKARVEEVIYDAEHFFDGFKSNPQYALATVEAALEGGADWVVLCDTNGGALPHEVGEVCARVGEKFGCRLGIHTHDDGGLAVANALEAVRRGCRQVQGTINGYGERCGNANLCTLIPNLVLKMGYRAGEVERLSLLASLSHFVSEVANQTHSPSYPYVGANAFAHKGGVHVSAVLKNPRTYEHIPPETVGQRRRFIVSELSGRANLAHFARERKLPLEKDDDRARDLLERLKAMEYEGYQFEAAEASLDLLMRRALGEFPDFFSLLGFRVIVEKDGEASARAEATVKVRVGDRVLHTAAEGEGPVNALDKALRKALESAYPALRKIRLVDYKVRVLDEKEGTGARVRVLIESADEEESWSTIGVSHNIIEASWQALVDSLSYGLWRRAQRKAREKSG